MKIIMLINVKMPTYVGIKYDIYNIWEFESKKSFFFSG